MNRCGWAIDGRGSAINCRGWTIKSQFIVEPRLFIAEEQRWLADERLGLGESWGAQRQPFAPICHARGSVPPMGDGVAGALAAVELLMEDDDLRKAIFLQANSLTGDLADAKESWMTSLAPI